MPNYDDVAFYYGTHTGMEIDNAVDLAQAWNTNGVLVISISGISALPCTITNSQISSRHIVADAYLSNPAAQVSGWSVNTSDGSLTVSGSLISGETTNLRLTLIKYSRSITTTAT